MLPYESSLFLWCMGILGAAVGSFLNVVIYRIPHGYKVSLPSRSACMKCKRKLEWFENIPILSYILLRGRCRVCQVPFAFRYLLVEMLTAALFVAIYSYFGLSFSTLYYAVFSAALLAVTFIDLDHRIIPDVISFPGIALGFLGSFFTPELSGWSSAIGIAIGGGSFWFLGWSYEKLTSREGLGFGDVKLLAMIGAFLGAKGVLGTILISSIAGSVVGIILMVVQKKNMKMAIPYGPFLAIGALTYLFWGEYIMSRVFIHS